MNLLVLATKAPWPPIDGGRLLLLHTLEGLAAAGCRPVLVAPVNPAQFDLETVAGELSTWCEPRLVPASPVPAAAALARSWRAPLAITRHSLAPVRREVEELLRTSRFDLVHAEQLQALPQAEPAFRRGIPVVLRAQNVESDLWAALARARGGFVGRALAFEARRLARWEGEAVRRAAATFALTSEDAARLHALAGNGGSSRVRVVRAPFPGLPPGKGHLPGEPSLVLLGSRGWLPNEDAVAWFLEEIWPAVRAELPGAVLHLFGAGAPPQASVVSHPSPADSAEAFAPGSILVVPLRIASGVRMKVLEAWARGVPVVGTPTALAGLEVEDSREALVAADAPGFTRALARLHREGGLAAALVDEGKWALSGRHEPAGVATELLAAYAETTRQPS
ncbi:MAG TPA: glycosyltransferase [Thermoanaerobaculia bacterium]|nr:glycosyltransferase [Thermoanaerobaculia bacterium]